MIFALVLLTLLSVYLGAALAGDLVFSKLPILVLVETGANPACTLKVCCAKLLSFLP